MKVPLLSACLFALGSVSFSYGQKLSQTFQVGQKVYTTSGAVIGRAAPNLTEVSEYLSIPYAKAPVGSLRFAAPEPFIGHGPINATIPPLACPAQPYTTPLINQSPGQMSEDCLTLNVWTKPQTGEKRKAVLLWIHGGGWQSGTSNDPQINGQYFAENQDIVIVTINYRLNIFGFAGLPGTDQNVGLLDQRLAVEWVFANIAQFGGDPNRITLFGQSAGSASIDIYSYAWTEAPLVSGFIEESGTTTSFFDPAPPNNLEAWYNATQKLNCGGSSATLSATIICMRTKSFEDIIAATAASGLAALSGPFGPTVDNKTVFSDYAQRATSGRYIQRPYLIGNNDYEAGLFKIEAASLNLNLPDQFWAIFNLGFFSCPAEAAALPRTKTVPTYRYRFYGDYPNVRLTTNPDSGAWHGDEIPIIWRTTQDATGKADTPAEAAVGTYLNAAWAAFAKDPVSALSKAPFSWPKYNEGANTLIRLGYANDTSASYISPATYDESCETVRKILAGLPGGFTSLIFADQQTLAPLNEYANFTEMGGGSQVGY